MACWFMKASDLIKQRSDAEKITVNGGPHSPIFMEIKRDESEQRAVVVQDVVHERVRDDLGRR